MRLYGLGIWGALLWILGLGRSGVGHGVSVEDGLHNG